MQDQRPSVTVLIAAYRAPETIARAVASALAQPETAEVVVAIDASPDNTADAARAADDGTGRLRIIELERNRGPSAARNAALAASSAPWVTVLDDDDFMEPGRLGRLLAIAAGDWDIVADDLLIVQAGQEQGARAALLRTSGVTRRALDLAAFVEGNVPDPSRPRCELGFLKPLMRREFLDRHGLRYDESMRLGEDYDLYARALAHGARMLLTEPQGYIAVRRATSLSARHGAAELLALREADERMLTHAKLSAAAREALTRHYRSTDQKYQWQRLIDAVKARNLNEIAACFSRHPAVSAFLVARLSEQVRLRLFKAS